MNKTVDSTSSSSPVAPSNKVPAEQALSRLKLLAILGTFLFPLLLASIWLYVVRANDGEMGLSAKGELIKPAVPLQAFTLAERDASAFNQDSLRGIWTLFYAPIGECVEVCQRNLYHMRQVRLSLAQRMDRVQRVVLQEHDGQLPVELITEHPGLRVLSGQRAVLLDQINGATGDMESRTDALYLIDPFGNLMMRFPADLPPKSMLKDIKHLLKVSRIG